jgi:tetratricopeptide (TPR) repeat protein
MLTDDRWLELKRIVTEVLELPAESRADFLERTCPEALRPDADRLLGSCEWASSRITFLDTPAAEFAASIVADVEQHPVDLAALQAELAGRYTIERELGRGGMATVYLAKDERHGRRVALKVVHSGPAPHVAGSGAARFQREIEIAARLTHPHILPLHDSGSAAGGLYYVMPYVAGQSLREHLAHNGPPPVRDALRVLRDVARALAHAHRHGIVHRDIKPGNILLNLDGDALVADFGVAGALAAARTEGVSKLAFGTPAYSAPEQLTGKGLTDQRADLYALGVVAYELLVGARPIAGHSTREMHQAESPESLTNLRPDVPPALATLVTRLLARDPADRPQDATEVLQALDAVISHGAAKSRAGQGVLRVRPRLLALAIALLLVFAFVPAHLVLRWRSSAEEIERGTTNAEAYQAYMRGISLIEQSQPDAALVLFQKAIDLDSAYARAWAAMADAYTGPNLSSREPRHDIRRKARDAAERALELGGEFAEGLAVRAHQLLVYDCRWNDAQQFLERALALDNTNATAHKYYGLYLHAAGRHDSALVHLHSARTLNPRGPGGETLLGRVFVSTGQPDSAILYLRNALAFNRELRLAHEQIAHAYLQKGMSQNAIQSMQRAAELNGRDSARLAYMYAATGNPAEARRMLQRLRDSESASSPPTVGMAMAYAALGDKGEAFRLLENAHATGACMPLLGVSVGLESLRSEPRFAALLERIQR